MNDQQMKGKISRERDYLLQKLWDARVIVSLVLIAVLVRVGYGGNTLAPTQVVNTYDLSKKTDNFIGEPVTVRSQPMKKVGQSSFTVSDQKLLGGEPVVVINASGLAFDLPTDSDTKVQVTGDVRNLNIQNIERNYNLNLQDKIYEDYINKPAIIAKSILLAPRVGQITQNPRKYYGTKVAVMGSVDNIQSPVLFTLDESYSLGTEDLLVLFVATPKRVINKNQTVGMVGVVRPFVAADIERDYGITWDQRVRRQLEADYKNKPVFVADTIYP
ncbi:MAG: hypothetical protein KME49_00410 [Brasilonema octagenarum HA4186-MV1]|jgi:hypothetical protein|uniref:Uncharacterized protein n=1 Tax=Brasilonema octagenarum UFV-OR1 TaxID=417115 RepID=A0ABX1M9X0_9CYAN|nr:hypothetical protein [Brasilonema octagenarum]MBW4624004.1 hypothetical protein [Brasilonema octagenarum HA4186-MV1]NMF65392.1 hypothetical protein [Brasilonema octagenarum UFV-OR1]